MWGVCLDDNLAVEGLFQAVVEYKMDSTGDMVIMNLPKPGYKIEMKKIKELLHAPQFTYGEKVLICEYPEMVGNVVRIKWHFKREKYFYLICVADKIKSKRYFESDLMKSGI